MGGQKVIISLTKIITSLTKRLSINTLCYTATFSLIAISGHVTWSRPYYSTLPLRCRSFIQSFLLLCLITQAFNHFPYYTSPHFPQCFLKAAARSALVRPLANIAELWIQSMANSLSSTNPRTWWCMTSICFFWFWLSGSLVKVRLVSLLPSIFISLTVFSCSSSFRNCCIHPPSLAPWLAATYMASEVEVETVRYCLLH